MIGSSLSRAARVSHLTRLALAAAIAVTGSFALAGNAQAATDPVTIPGARFCGFDVTETVVTDKTKVTTTPRGDIATGHLVVTFANPANGKSQTFNVSGATHRSTTNGITTEIFTGPFFLIAGPTSRGNNPGLPAISVGTGRAVVTGDAVTGIISSVNGFSSTVPVTNVCTLLA